MTKTSCPRRPWLRLYARQNAVPAEERARQLIATLTVSAKNWCMFSFANDLLPPTKAQVAFGTRKAIGQEYAGAKTLRTLYHVAAQPTQSGAQRIWALDQREETARQLRVPVDAGPSETRFRRLLALFLDEEISTFRSDGLT